MNEKELLAVYRGMKFSKLIGVTTSVTLFASQSVYAADGSGSSTFLNLGIPGWVWLLVILAILIGITLLPKKWIEPPQAKKTDNKAPIPPAAVKVPVEKAPAVKAPVAEVKPQAVEVPKAPVITPTPVVVEKITPPITELAPQPDISKEVEVAKPVALDALEEAKQLLAQQRFPQAVGILNKGLIKDPSRSDLMLELLEIYLKQGDHEAFDSQYEQLKQLDDPFALIQAEELHRQLERPVVKEESDHIEYDSTKAVSPEIEPEPENSAPAHDYSADSLDFTTAKVQSDDLAHNVEPVVISPPLREFSLDEVNLKSSVSNLKQDTEEVTAKSNLDDFDFSSFDLVVPESTQSKVVEIPPVITKVDSPSIPAVEPEAKTTTPLDTTPLVDLDFNFDDSFAIEEDKQVVAKTEKSTWTTELADENFTSTSTTPVAERTLGDIIKGDDLSSLEEEFPFLQSVDTFQTRLDLARSYITIGEIDSARELLNEVAEQGASAQQTEARALIAKLAS
jgi:pilus assembly protein FimV